MTMEFMDSFDKYGTDANTSYLKMLDGLYADVTGAQLNVAPAPPAGIYVLNFAYDGLAHMRRALPSGNQATVGVAHRYYLSNLPVSNNHLYLCDFRDSANSQNIVVYANSTGAIGVVRGDGTALGATSSPVISANAWHHVEMLCTFNAVTGSVQVFVDGIRVLNLTGINTVGPNMIASCAQWQVGVLNGTGATFAVKDQICYNGAGTHNNSQVGDVQVALAMPTADGTTNAWTPSAGNRWQCVSNIPPVDATYVSSTAAAQEQDFQLADLPVAATSVKAVQTTSRQWKSDAGDAQIKVGMLSAGVHGYGSDRAVSTAPTYYGDIFEVDPNTATPWSPAAVNAAQASITRTV